MGSSNDLSLKVLLQCQDLASGSLKGFGSVLSGLSGPAGIALGALLAVGAAVVGIGVQAVQMAGQYDQSLRMVQALTGASSAQMKQYDIQLKQLAMNAGVAPNALAQGLYNVLSAGYSGKQAMDVLTLATEDAKIGMTNATTTTNALTVALKAFNVPASQFNAVNGEVLRTVTAGKMSMQDYAGAISKSSSVAVQYKDSMSDMNAVLATLTSSGVKNAAVASTDYNNLLKVLSGNTSAVAKAAEKINPAFNGNAFAAMNVHDKVMYLNQMIVEHGHNISEVIGKQQNAAAAFTMLSTHASTYTQNLKNLSDQQANAKATSQAWAITQGGFNQTMSRLGATVQVLLIDIGQQLLPVLTSMAQAVLPIVSGITTWITKSNIITTGLGLLGGVIKNVVGFVSGLVTGISNVVRFFQQNQVAAAALLIPLGMLAAILVSMGVAAIPGLIVTIGTLIAGFITWAAAAAAAAIATLAATWPLLLIGAIIGAVIAVVILLWTHWKQVSTWIMQQLGRLGAWFHLQFALIGAIFSWLGTQIHDKIAQFIAWFMNLQIQIGLHILAIIAFFQNLPGNIIKFFQQLITGIVQKLVDLKNQAGQKASDVITGIENFFKSLPGKALQWGKDMITQFIQGIQNMASGVTNAVSNIGKSIASFLHFSKPDTGPLVDVDKWMPDMLDLMTKGIIAGNPKLQAAVQTTAKVIAGVNTPPARVSGYGAIPYGQPPISSSYSSYAGGNTHNGDIVIHAAPGMNVKQLADEIERRQNLKYRRSGVMSNPATGARSS